MILNVNLKTINRLLGIGNSEVVGNIIIEKDIINESENEAIIDSSARKVTTNLGISSSTGSSTGNPIITEYYRGYNVYCKQCFNKLTSVILTDYFRF